MLESKHPGPDNLAELVMENNAMLQAVLHNQAYMMEFIIATLQTASFIGYGDPKPNSAFMAEKDKNAQWKIGEYQKLVSEMFLRLKNKIKW